MDAQQRLLTYSMNATVMLMARLIAELDEKGLLSKAEYGAKLLKMADDAERERSVDLPPPRLDILMVRQVVKNLDLPPERWTPTVIDGGRE